MFIQEEYNDFIGIYKNAMSAESCERFIEQYKRAEKSLLVKNRQQFENNNVPKSEKDNNLYSLSGTSLFLNENADSLILNNDVLIHQEFQAKVLLCYKLYCEQYGIISSLGKHGLSGAIKIQKTDPKEGYHVWHCEHGSYTTGNRMLLVMLYLNTVNDGGETEFLYQSLRIKPEQGTMVICPAGFTHTHRGNPPLKETKYMTNVWIEFMA